MTDKTKNKTIDKKMTKIPSIEEEMKEVKETEEYDEISQLTCLARVWAIKERDMKRMKKECIEVGGDFLHFEDIGFYFNEITKRYELLDNTIGIIVDGDEICDRYNCDEFIKKHIEQIDKFVYIIAIL